MSDLELAAAAQLLRHAIDTNDPAELAGNNLIRTDGSRLPLADITLQDLRSEINAHAAIVSLQSAALEPAQRFIRELQEFYGPHADAAALVLQDMLAASWPAGQDLPTVPHPDGGVGLDLAFVVGLWDDLSDHERRILRAQCDLDARGLGARGIHLAAALGRRAIQSQGPTGGSLDTPDDHLMIGLRVWDELDPAGRDQLAARVLALPEEADE